VNTPLPLDDILESHLFVAEKSGTCTVFGPHRWLDRNSADERARQTGKLRTNNPAETRAFGCYGTR
jgi:hypothetical protein